MFKRIDTVFLPVRDLGRAISWFTENFGFTHRWTQGNYAAINVGETVLTLFQPEGEFKAYGWHAPFNFYVTDVEAAHQRLTAAGASVGAVERFPDFAHFPFTDPDGNQLGVCWFPEK